MKEFCPQLSPQHKGCNILPQVVVRPDMEHLWFDALGQFSSMMRRQNGFNHFVSIENEEGFVDNAGALVISVVVSNETLLMTFPAGTWGWKDGDVS